MQHRGESSDWSEEAEGKGEPNRSISGEVAVADGQGEVKQQPKFRLPRQATVTVPASESDAWLVPDRILLESTRAQRAAALSGSATSR